MILRAAALCAFLLAGTVCGRLRAADAAGGGADTSRLRVMSFNIRYGTANDGENHWDKRKDFLLETVLKFDPDLLGTQETLEFQRDFLAAGLPGYDHLGVGRDDGAKKGEMTALYYRRGRFEKMDGGHFWLSERPEVPGSKSWDTSLTRMVTWVKLRDLRHPGAQPIAFFNTHFDHRGPQARLESARLLRRRLATLGAGCRLIVTGDFNAGQGSDPYKALFGTLDGRESPVLDTYRVAHPTAFEDESSFNDFTPNVKGRARIDWIGASREWTVESATIDRVARNGRTPSDHYPVMAVLRPK